MGNSMFNTCCNTCSTAPQPDRRQETGDRRQVLEGLRPLVLPVGTGIGGFADPFVYALVADVHRKVQTVSGEIRP